MDIEEKENDFVLPEQQQFYDDSYISSLIEDNLRLEKELKIKQNTIDDLRVCLHRLEIELKQFEHLKAKNLSDSQLNEVIKKKLPMLKSNQLDLMMNVKKRVNWTPDEIATGFASSYLGRRGYNFTIHKLHIPHPSIRSLQRWGERIQIAPGILHDCFNILKAMGTSLTEVRWW